MITLPILQKIIHATPAATLAKVVDPINETCSKYEINTINRVAAFCAQTAHESQFYTKLHENTNYSVQGLMKTWPTHFPTMAIAEQYAHNPTKIAARAYANRMGNGDEASGEGAKFLGRGCIGLTGKFVYQQYADYKKLTLDQTIAYLETIEGAFDSSGWFFLQHHLNGYSDKLDITGQTKIINGGEIGLAEREQLFQAFRAALMVA